MNHNKLIIVTLIAILGIATAFTINKLVFTPQEKAIMPLAGGANIPIGLPGIIAKNNNTDSMFNAASAILWDRESGNILFKQNGFERRPIASITKLMTAMVALDHGIDWNKTVTILPEDHAIGSRLLLLPGESITMRDLFTASLLGSANNATKAYVRELGIPHEDFIRRMNRKAIEIGLDQTEFTDVTGLEDTNVSTAYEVAQFAAHAFNNYPEIAKATSLQEYSFIFQGSGREHTIKNTNKARASGEVNLSASKTGFLYASQYCLVIQGEGGFKDRIAVILGSPNGAEHFRETQRLLELPVP